MEIINFIINPHNFPSNSQDKDLFNLYSSSSILLYKLSNVRNKVLYPDLDLVSFLHRVFASFKEHSEGRTCKDNESIHPTVDQDLLMQPSSSSSPPSSSDQKKSLPEIFVNAAWSSKGMCAAGPAFGKGRKMAHWTQKMQASSPNQAESLAVLITTKIASGRESESIQMHNKYSTQLATSKHQIGNLVASHFI